MNLKKLIVNSSLSFIALLICLPIVNNNDISLETENNTNDNEHNDNSSKNITLQRKLELYSSDKILFDNFSCETNSECNNGICMKNQCVCYFGYITQKIDTESCIYKQNKQTTAFILELFLGFGVGHFYCEKYGRGIWKAIMMLIGMLSICRFPVDSHHFRQKMGLIIVDSVFFVSWAILCATFFIYDLVEIASGSYLDGNEIPLLGWGRNNY